MLKPFDMTALAAIREWKTKNPDVTPAFIAETIVGQYSAPETDAPDELHDAWRALTDLVPNEKSVSVREVRRRKDYRSRQRRK